MGLMQFLDRVYAEEQYSKWKRIEGLRETIEGDIKSLESEADAILKRGGLFSRTRFREYRKIIRKKQERLTVLKKKELIAKDKFKQVEGSL